MLKWGIMSTGTIAKKFATTVNQMKDEAQLIAVGSRSQASAQGFADEFSIPKAYPTYEALVADPQIDAIYVCTPNNLHFENVKLCLKAGKHVLCEKPFTTSAAEAEELFALAKGKGLFLMEAFWIKHFPLHKELKQMLADGVIGTVKHLRAEFGFIANGSRRTRKLDLALGGGALLDIGIYNIGFACMVLGYHPLKIQSAVRFNEMGSDELNTMILEFEGGATANLMSTIGMAFPTEGLIYGSLGTIRLPNYQLAETMTVNLYDGTSYVVERPFEINGFEYQIRETANCIAQGKTSSSVVTPEDTIAVLKIMDQIRETWGMKFDSEKSN